MTTTTSTPTATMRAVVQRRYGRQAAQVLSVEQVPVPAPGDGQVLVRVHAAGVDRGTWHLMTGRPYLMRVMGFGVRRPRSPVPGMDLAGTVVALGRGVSDLAVGDEVLGTGRGTFAELAVARADRLVRSPANLSFEQAAALTVSGTTALQAVRDQGQVQAGQRVLVIGASGGVGSYAVQLCAAADAHVTGVCSAAKSDFVHALGAERVLAREDDDLLGDGEPYDVILDVAGNRPIRVLRAALAPGGTLVIVGGEDGGPLLGGIERNLAARLRSVFTRQRLTAFITRQRRADLETLVALAASGSIVPALDRTFPLEDVSAAVQYLADGRVRGKVVVTLADRSQS